jgi:hypothetical protein
MYKTLVIQGKSAILVRRYSALNELCGECIEHDRIRIIFGCIELIHRVFHDDVLVGLLTGPIVGGSAEEIINSLFIPLNAPSGF